MTELERGAQAVHEWAKEPETRIAIIAEDWPTINKMVTALNKASSERILQIVGSRQFKWENGSRADFFISLEPDRLRGVQTHKAWIHEYIENPEYLHYCVRLGGNPEILHTWNQKSDTFRLCSNVTLLSRAGLGVEVRTNRNQSEKLSKDAILRLQDWLFEELALSNRRPLNE